MKKCFLTGLAILLPIVLTVAIVFFFINLLTNPFVNPVAEVLNHYDLFNHPFYIFNGQQVLFFVSKFIVLLALVFVVFVVGLLGKIFIVHYLVRFGEYIIHNIPVVNKIYKAIQDIVHTIFGHSEQRFSSVVLVPFPHSEMYSIGLVTSGAMPPSSDPEYQQRVSVFVPGTPNPAMGFMLLFPKDKILPIDMKVHDALKLVISCGVVAPNDQKE
jgi:uncharacterized membrane protein